MTELDPHHAATDRDLIALVRAGDPDAYEVLFVRHREAAIRYARHLTDASHAEDLCAEAFAKILDLLRRGKGPDIAFRAYLLTTVRTGYLNHLRLGRREDLVPDHEPSSRMTPVLEDPDARFDGGAIRRAFTALPERWQAALWLTTVEGLSHKEAGERLGIKVNAVASLSFRARGALREAYLAEHLLETDDPRCLQVRGHLPSHLRDGLGHRRQALVDDHVSTCLSCSAAFLELSHVDTSLRVALLPLLVTGFSVASLAAPAHVLGGLVALVKGWGSGATATAVSVAAVSVAAAGIAFGSMTPDPPEPPVTEQVAPEVLSKNLLPEVAPGTTQPSTSATSLPEPVPATLTATPAPTSPQPTSTAGPTTAPVSPPPPPTTPPTTGPTAPITTPPAPAAREMSVQPLQASSVMRSGSVWRQATIPVSNPEPGTAMRLVATHTTGAQVVPASSGWICGTPGLDWAGGATDATATTDCVYDGPGDGSALQVEYWVKSGARLTAALTPPDGFLDTSLLDNQGILELLTITRR